MISGLLAGCTKSKDFLANNTQPTGVGTYPISTNALVDMADNSALNNKQYTAGSSFNTELQITILPSPVKETNLYTTVGTGSRTKMLTIPYASAFSNIKRLDTLLVPYTVPVGTAVGTSIKLEYEVLNQNALNVIRTATIKVK